MGIDPADERCVPFYQRLRHHGLPLLSHTGQERSFTRANDALADPQRLRLPSSQGVTVIAAHVASTGSNAGEPDIDRLARLMVEFSNLYAEISSLTQVNKLGYLEQALRRPEFAGRLCCGSDFPLINTALVSPWYFPLNLTQDQMERVSAIANPWDRDVALKQALGVPQAENPVFKRSSARLTLLPIRCPRWDTESGGPLGLRLSSSGSLGTDPGLGDSGSFCCGGCRRTGRRRPRVPVRSTTFRSLRGACAWEVHGTSGTVRLMRPEVRGPARYGFEPS
jgi:hypothetical protein